MYAIGIFQKVKVILTFFFPKNVFQKVKVDFFPKGEKILVEKDRPKSSQISIIPPLPTVATSQPASGGKIRRGE